MKVLFICTGNTCRSPMAEKMAKEIFPKDYLVISAGINAWEGSRASNNAIMAMMEEGIDLKDHSAAAVTEEKMFWADVIVPMTLAQEEQLRILFPGFEAKIKRLGAWAGMDKDVIDPWGGSLERYCHCKDEIEAMLQEMLKVLSKLRGGRRNEDCNRL